jgi:hypothetical protein
LARTLDNLVKERIGRRSAAADAIGRAASAERGGGARCAVPARVRAWQGLWRAGAARNVRAHLPIAGPLPHTADRTTAEKRVNPIVPREPLRALPVAPFHAAIARSPGRDACVDNAIVTEALA